jgi:hypothetical protein
MLHCFALLFTWQQARNSGDRVVFGPRFALHPAVVQLPDGRQGVDVALALRENRSVIDRLCRLALEEYARWARSPGAQLRATTDEGKDIAVGVDGTFTAPADEVVTLRCGDTQTVAPVDARPPFSDARLRDA